MQIIEHDEALAAQIIGMIRKRQSWPKRDPMTLEARLTEVIYCLNKAYLQRFKDYPIDDDLLLLFTQGHAIQAWLTGSFKSSKSIFKEGIWMGVDRRPITEEDLPWEVKMTYASSKRRISKEYRRQVLGYMKGLEVLEFAMPHWCVMGDWSWIKFSSKGDKDPRHPILKVPRIIATQEEVDENWEWLQERKCLLFQSLKTGKLPSNYVHDYCETWECRNCQCKADCPAAKEPRPRPKGGAGTTASAKTSKAAR